MSLRTTIMLTTAPARTGKTWYRAAKFLLDEFLKHHDGVHISNFPIMFEPWKDAAGREHGGLIQIGAKRGYTETELRQRVQVISKEEIKRWENSKWKANEEPYGPWNTFSDADLSGAHIAIDEFHNFCGAKHPPQIRKRWGEWFGEIGHQGATVEIISQHPDKIAKEVIIEAEIKLELTGSMHEKHPFLRIKYYYWDSLLARWYMGWNPKVWVREKRKAAERWIKEEDRVFRIDPELFGVYNSTNQPHKGGRAGSIGEHEWKRMGVVAFYAWFLAACFVPLVKFFAIWGFVAALVFGSQWFMPFLFSVMPAWLNSRMLKKPATVEKTPVVKAAAVAKISEQEAVGMAGVRGELTEADQKRVAALVDQVRQLNADLSAEREELEKATADKQKLADKLNAAFTIATLQPDSVTFRAGYTYKVGEVIDWGPYEGRTLESVDFPRRIVSLDDGRKLRMGVSGDVDFSKWLLSLRDPSKRNDGSGPDVRGTLPSNQPGNAKPATTASGSGTAANAVR